MLKVKVRIFFPIFWQKVRIFLPLPRWLGHLKNIYLCVLVLVGGCWKKQKQTHFVWTNLWSTFTILNQNNLVSDTNMSLKPYWLTIVWKIKHFQWFKESLVFCASNCFTAKQMWDVTFWQSMKTLKELSAHSVTEHLHPRQLWTTTWRHTPLIRNLYARNASKLFLTSTMNRRKVSWMKF